MSRQSRDNPILAEATAHWSLFAPAALVAVCYFLLWWGLMQFGYGGSFFARAAQIVFLFVPPVLLVYGFMRYYSVWILADERGLDVSPGWPRRSINRFSWEQISDIRLSQGAIGQLLDVGAIVIYLDDDRSVRVNDIAMPAEMVDELRSQKAVHS
jgi:hypothetical protein